MEVTPTDETLPDEAATRPFAALCDHVELSGGHVRLVRDVDGFALVIDLPTSAKRRRFRFAGLSFSSISDLDVVAETLLAWIEVTQVRGAERAGAAIRPLR